MPSIRITEFGGILPRLDGRLLPNKYAQTAHNVVLDDGRLRPMRQWVSAGPGFVVPGNQSTQGVVGFLGSNPFLVSDPGSFYPVSDAFTENLQYPIIVTDSGGAIKTLGGRNVSLFPPITYPPQFNGYPIRNGASPLTSGFITAVTPRLMSERPTSRSYAATLLTSSGEESGPVLLGTVRPVAVPLPPVPPGGPPVPPPGGPGPPGPPGGGPPIIGPPGPPTMPFGADPPDTLSSGPSNNMSSGPPSGGTRMGFIYEGDAVTVDIEIAVSVPTSVSRVSHVALYRSSTGFKSGDASTSTFDTEYMRVILIPITAFSFIGNRWVFRYIDALFDHELQATPLMTKEYDTQPKLKNLHALEGGWLIGINPTGWFLNFGSSGNFRGATIHVSERGAPHAWPIANVIRPDSQPLIGGGTSAVGVESAVFRDTLFAFFNGTPVAVTVSSSDTVATKIDLYHYPEALPALFRTMVPTTSGAAYLSSGGVVMLQAGAQAVPSLNFLKAADSFGIGNFGLSSTFKVAAFWRGRYMAFAGDKGFWFDTRSSALSSEGEAELTTFDCPPATISRTGPFFVVSLFGALHVLFDRGVYVLPWAGYAAPPGAALLTYIWRSKHFVFPAATRLSAAKVVREAAGSLLVRVFGDGRLVYQRIVVGSDPFRLPGRARYLSYEVQLEGTAVVSEVHLATSMAELSETGGLP